MDVPIMDLRKESSKRLICVREMTTGFPPSQERREIETTVTEMFFIF